MEDIHNKLDKENPGSMSNKTAADNMKVIQSESQRMARETSINVPYHKPKQHTLKEFLSRRSIQRPANLQNKKPMASIRMNKTELEEYALVF